MRLTHYFEKHVCVIAISGEITFTTIPDFEKYFAEHSSSMTVAAKSVLFNLSNVEFISSIGYGTFLTAANSLKKGDVSVAVCSANEMIVQCFQAFDANGLIALFDDEAEALEALD